ncbi:alpha/beta hydrolase [Croceivirga thetidis]|uniref:Alpha/beta hydrolase n=1 Tax=Croceivirga thetidis TaxID=2721623 RepID=A0ABX1GP75_9FLAO|nr:hypothetical protein [Croceivirga thetidis]NKI30567.1 hypothetical protein [Croceivirga thetidis]
MTNKLLVLSDMWGVKKGLWITSYFGYLQQSYEIDFFDCQQLAHVNELVGNKENLHKAFVEGGIDTAVAHLLKKINEPTDVLAFSTGGTIAYKAALQGLPVKSMTLVSATRIRLESERPECEVNLIYGGNDKYAPSDEWANNLGLEKTIIPNFGHELYTDQKIIDEVSLALLEGVIKKAV